MKTFQYCDAVKPDLFIFVLSFHRVDIWKLWRMQGNYQQGETVLCIVRCPGSLDLAPKCHKGPPIVSDSPKWPHEFVKCPLENYWLKSASSQSCPLHPKLICWYLGSSTGFDIHPYYISSSYIQPVGPACQGLWTLWFWYSMSYCLSQPHCKGPSFHLKMMDR